MFSLTHEMPTKLLNKLNAKLYLNIARISLQLIDNQTYALWMVL